MLVWALLIQIMARKAGDLGCVGGDLFEGKKIASAYALREL